MAIDFEAEGLLKGTRGRAREARQELLEDLAAEGVPLEELRQAVEEDRLALLPVERVLEAEGRRYTAAEIADLSGVDADFLRRQRRALGLPSPEEEEGATFTDEDLEAAKRIKALQDAGLPQDGLLEVSRAMGMAMSQVVAANRALISGALHRPGDTERDLGLRFASVAEQFNPMIAPMLEYVYKLHQREQIRNEAIGFAELRGGLPDSQEVSAAFADLVGFTALGEELAPEELAAVTGRLDELARDVTGPPVRLVKMIGDAAMLVSSDNDALLEAALAVVEAAGAESDFPLIRAGAARGPALARGGDWYGRPVNLASRITAIAYPSSVLASEEVHDASEDGFRWSFAGARRIKGLDSEVNLFRARRGDDPGAP